VSALTKTFILLHVVMSMLLAAGLIVFVNRLDVSAQATKASNARIARLEDEKNVAQAEATTVRAASTAIQQQAQSQVEQLRSELAKANQDALGLRGQIAELQSHSAQDKASLTAAMEAQKVAQQNQGTLQGQLADLRVSQDKLTQQFTEANLSINDLNNRLQTTERARRDLAERLAAATDQLQNTPQGDRADIAGGRIAPSTRNHVEGVIKERQVIAGRPYATISIGSNDAIAKNMQLKIISQTGEWLGYVTVTSVDQEEAIGVLSGPRVNQVRPNDRVTNQLAGQG
jgi:DNA repair exonuclease SbcCD ATPase subunit